MCQCKCRPIAADFVTSSPNVPVQMQTRNSPLLGTAALRAATHGEKSKALTCSCLALPCPAQSWQRKAQQGWAANRIGRGRDVHNHVGAHARQHELGELAVWVPQRRRLIDLVFVCQLRARQAIVSVVLGHHGTTVSAPVAPDGYPDELPGTQAVRVRNPSAASPWLSSRLSNSTVALQAAVQEAPGLLA